MKLVKMVIDLSTTTKNKKTYTLYLTNSGCFKECGIYGISVDELSEYKAGKSIVFNFHDRYGYVKMIASDKVISIEKEE